MHCEALGIKVGYIVYVRAYTHTHTHLYIYGKHNITYAHTQT